MIDLREQVAIAIRSANLAPSDLREMPIDRIGALAFADRLGGELWRLKWAGQSRAYRPALALLIVRSRRICGDLQMRTKLCGTVLVEWLDDICNTCLGRGILLASNIAAERHCPTCGGTGERRVSDVWRALQLGFDGGQYAKWERRYLGIQARLLDAELQAHFDIARQLGRSRLRPPGATPVDFGPRLATLRATQGAHAPALAYSHPA